jgi:hypothetical protein
VADLRAVMSAAADADVPEPSPLFWDHLSARVREAVGAENATAPDAARLGWVARIWSWRVLVPAGTAAALALTAAVALRAPAKPDPAASSSVGGVASVDSGAGLDRPVPLGDDPTLDFIADLAGELDWDDAAQAGLTTGSRSVDQVVFEMTDAERRELHRILQEELSRQGA